MVEGSNRWQGSTESGELRAPHTHLLATAWWALKTPCLPEPDAQSTSAELGCHGFKFIKQKEGKEKAGGAFSALYVGASQAVHQEINNKARAEEKRRQPGCGGLPGRWVVGGDTSSSRASNPHVQLWLDKARKPHRFCFLPCAGGLHAGQALGLHFPNCKEG